jgi:rare lipoprotein A
LVNRRNWLSPLALAFSLLPMTSAQALVADGLASYYGDRFNGRRTASGERFNQHELTAAHRTLEFGTRVLVTNKANGRSVEVTITDRGPYTRGRSIDLSKGAARELGMLGRGVAPVKLRVLKDNRATSEADARLQPANPVAVAQAEQLMMDLF